MERLCAVRMLVVCLLTGTLLWSPWTGGASAKGPDFPGQYELSNVNDLGDTVQLTFSALVFNYSGKDVLVATLVLASSLPPEPESFCSIPAIAIVDRGQVQIQCLATIPHREYEHWIQGAPPNLHIDTSDANGNSVQYPVSLSPAPISEVN